MSEIKRVKIQSIVESQIPEFLNDDSPLFREFLEQYYISQEHQTGVVDLAVNLQQYKSIDNFNNETFYSKVGICTLAEDVTSFDDVIAVNHTIGFPQKYGLLKIDDEIITYTGITTNSFTGCVRGFSGIDQHSNNESFIFSKTDSASHIKAKTVTNLNLLFFNEIFKKFKTQFLPGFEDRQFVKGLNLKNILSRAKDFYITKGTDTSYKILFSILFGKDIQVIKPQDYLLRPSDNNYLVTKNILVEQIVRDETLRVNDSDLRKQLKGKTIFEILGNGKTASASIYNVEYRPVDDRDLYEISLDSTSFIFNFEPTKKTNISETVTENSTFIIVDSTVGFKKSGSLFIKTSKLANPITLTYTDKTSTEFLGVSGVIADLNFGEELVEENFLYSYLDDGTKVEFRLINIIDTIDYSQTSSLRVGDKIQLSEFGTDLNDRKEFNFWNYNIPTTHKIKSISSNRIYFYDKLTFIIGDKFNLLNPDDENDNVLSATVEDYGFDDTDGYYVVIDKTPISTKTEIKKITRKANSNNNYFSSISILPTGVQNTYVDYNFDNFYVTSSGLPNDTIYSTDRRTNVTKTTNSNWITDVGITSVLNCPNHNFYTGEKIYYSSSSNSGIKTSTYFLTKYDDDNIKLSYSNTDLYTKNYIKFSNVGIEDSFVKLNYQNKTLEHQKLFKKFNLTKKEQFFDDPEKRKTINKKIGILADGVEIFSTTTFQDNIYYGKLDSVNVNASGQGYDVINFSGITVEDNSGSGAIVNGCITGSLNEVKLLSPGIGYQSKPKITLTGGNGSGAVLESNLVKTRITSNFKATSIYSNSIIFSQNHNFDNFEEVFYNKNSNTSISPLIDSSSYFVGVTSTTQIKLYNTKIDAISGINTISISGIGYSGIHSLKTLNSKNTITKIYVKNGGSGYSNRFVAVPSLLSADNQTVGINTFDDYIFAKNHNFKNEDLVLYTTSGTVVSGLSTQINYHVTVVDENKFKLSLAGVATNISRENYINKKYISFDSIGVGTHKFSYPPIQINVEAISGITTTIIEPSLDPIVLGSFDNIFVENSGSNYGTPDIINFHRRPLVSVRKQTSEALLKPIISDGLIVDVQILNAGKGYANDIDIVVRSESGKYAELYPTIVDGKITQISVINSGINYDKTNTTLDTKKRGSDARFEGNVFEWQINQIEKNKSIINSEDEGIIIPSDVDEFGLQFINYYPSKKLRKNLKNFIDEKGKEEPPTTTTNPYQILGWAYDGNPIFGPYGKINGTITQIKSSYKQTSKPEIDGLINSNIRPNFDSGFFLQDFVYNKATSGGHLDEYNGMFISNSDFPNINYGYFLTLDDSNGVKKPQYPYLIGSEFKDLPIEENFEPSFNQELDFNNLDIVRNTGPYYLNSSYASYDLINKVESKYKQEFVVKQIQSSGINSISIYNTGQDYKPGDNIIFDNLTSGGTGISAAISRVEGKEVSSIQIGVSTFFGVTFITKGTRVKGITGTPHNLITNDEILVTSISSSPYNYIQGFKKVLVNQKSVGLINDIPNQSTTGVTTYISVNDVSGFEVDNLIGINTETLRVIDISSSESKLFVNRYQNYAGIHTAGIVSVILLPNTFTFNAPQYDDTIIENKTSYFNPSNTIGIGTIGTNYYKLVGIKTDFGTVSAGTSYIGINTVALKNGDYVSGTYVSVGTTIVNIGIGSIQISSNNTLGGGIFTTTYSIQRSIYDKFIPSRSIYIPNHKYYTGQLLTYNVGLGGTGIVVSNTGTGSTFRINQNQTVYAVNLGNDYVGLSTLGFTTTTGIGTSNNSLYFFSPTTNIGLAHSLTTQYSKITGTFENYSVTVSTAQTHGLQTDDKIKFNVLPSFSNTIKLRYDTTLRKITTDKIDFNASLVGVNTQTNEITITGNKLKTGDKVVYYTNTNTVIGGLTNNNTYYVLKQDPDKIKLSNYFYDTTVGTCVSFTNVGVSTHSIALINPPISLTKGDVLTFDLTDAPGMDLRLYKDPNFSKEIESFKYLNKKLNTRTTDVPNELYYNLIPSTNSSTDLFQISSDKEVAANNRIKIVPSTFNNEYPIIGIGSTTFKFNLNTKPENTSHTSSSVFYDTNSTNTSGPISKIKVNFGGKRYTKLPKISSIETISGKNSILRSSSSTIGKVSQLERVKDGFNYPTDTTLTPFLSSPAIVQIKDIARIDYIGITTGGKGYNTAPSLKVIGNDKIKLSAELQSGSIVGVKVVENTNDLITSLRIVPINNSNGYEIDDIVAEDDGSEIRLELLNDTQLYPLITTGYGKTETIFPFAIGDEIFIEKCRQIKTEDNNKKKIDNFNSKDYGYKFFTVTGISSENFTVTFSMTGVKDTLSLNQPNREGNYTNSNGYGVVINKKDMPEFEMILIDDLSYISGEKVIGITTSNGNIVFSATVMENGWDNDINQLRLIDAKGELEIGNKLKGEKSLLNGTVEFVNKFNLKSTLGATRDKVDDAGNEVGFLNNYQQRISDNSYYQKFSYSIKSEVSYDVWKEPVRSVIHPAGFKEFSDLDVISIVPSTATKNLKVGIANSTLDLLINLDAMSSVYSKNNLSLVTEDGESLFEDGSIERVNIGAEETNVAGIGITGPIFGIALKPYTLSKTNKVLIMDDISSQFDGSNEYISIGTITATFNSFHPYYINLNTDNLRVGDYVGFSTLLIPDNTVIDTIGIGSIRLNLPHRLGIGTQTSDVKIRRRLPGNSVVGIKSFKLTSNKTSIFYREFVSSDSGIVKIDSDVINLSNHNFQTGQKILYSAVIGDTNPTGAATTLVDNAFAYSINKRFSDNTWASFDMTIDGITFDSNT